ncbi:MAG: hypothetical protein AAGA60_18590 [Cyanobacteria bacterium P01_E01_bin.42]
MAILKGVLNGQKYAEIAEQYQCSTGHVKDKGYQLWQVLSEVLGEELNKSNVSATIERLGVANSYSSVNLIQIGDLNHCANADSSAAKSPHPTTPDSVSKTPLTETQTKTILKLMKLGLNSVQIADAIDLPLEKVQQVMDG